jgi:hypothetical protein
MSLNSRLSLVMVLVAVFGCKAGKGGGSGEIDRTCTRSAAPLLLNDCANGGHQATKDQQASPPCDAAPDLICGGRGECNWETLTCDGRKADFECVRPSKEGERCITDCDCSVNFFCDDQSAVCVAYAPQQDHRGVRFTWPPCDDSVYKPGDAVTIDYDFSYCGPRPGQTATNDLAWIPWNLAVVQCDNNPRGIFSTVDGEGNTIGSLVLLYPEPLQSTALSARFWRISRGEFHLGYVEFPRAHEYPVSFGDTRALCAD